MKIQRLFALFIDIIVFSLGMMSLLAPFIFSQARRPGLQTATYPIMVSLIMGLCVLIMLLEAQSSLVDSKMIAFLAVLIAINAALRFLENAIPGPGGFSPIFFLIILTGYTFGSRVGFLMGAMTLLVSGLITGGIGPWLPGQMITAGWVGQSSVLLTIIVNKLGWKGKPIEIVLLAAFGAVWGIVFGMIMNLWFWPFLGAGIGGQSFSQAVSIIENFQRYAAYYLATSFIWDISRSIGNVLIITMMAKPVLKIYQRFKLRFAFENQGEIIQ